MDGIDGLSLNRSNLNQYDNAENNQTSDEYDQTSDEYDQTDSDGNQSDEDQFYYSDPYDSLYY